VCNTPETRRHIGRLTAIFTAGSTNARAARYQQELSQVKALELLRVTKMDSVFRD